MGDLGSAIPGFNLERMNPLHANAGLERKLSLGGSSGFDVYRQLAAAGQSVKSNDDRISSRFGVKRKNLPYRDIAGRFKLNEERLRIELPTFSTIERKFVLFGRHGWMDNNSCR